MQTHGKKMALATAIVVALLLGWALIAEQKHKQQVQAANALFQLKTILQADIAAKKYSEVGAKFADLAKKYSGTPAGFEAALSAADMYVEAKQYDQAIQQYSLAVDQATDGFTKTLALYNRGVAQENSGKLQDALQSFDQAVKVTSGDSLKPELMMAQARAYESLGDAKKAVELYRSIQDKFAAKPYYANMAAAFLSRIQAKVN